MHRIEKISSVGISNMLESGVQGKDIIYKDKSYLIYQELNIGCHAVLFQHKKYKSSYLCGEFYHHHGITKVNIFQKYVKSHNNNLLKYNNKKQQNNLLINKNAN